MRLTNNTNGNYTTRQLKLPLEIEKLIDIAFWELNLHRLSAHVQEENIPSIRLLLGLGFEKEGICKDFLCLNGIWTDHLQYSRWLPVCP